MTETTAALNDLDKQKGPHGSASRPQRVSMERVSSARRLSEGELGSIKTPQNDVRKGRNTNQLVFLRRVVMKAMMQHRLSLSFRKPVDAALLNLFDYHDIIKEPMDFGTIKSRLEENFYWSAQECVQDFKLVFSNCYKYNQPNEEVVANAKELESFFNAKIGALPKPEMEVEAKAVAKCSRETLGLQDYLSSYFAPSPGVEVRSRTSTQRTSVGVTSRKTPRKGAGRVVRCGKKTPAVGKIQEVMPSEVSSGVKEDDVVKGVEESIKLKQGDGEVIATGKVDPPPSLVTNMAHNWKDVEAGKATQQSSANFKSRIEFTSRPFKNWGVEAGRLQKAKRLTEVSLPGMRVCALSSSLAAIKVGGGLVNEQEEEDDMMAKEERGEKMTEEEDLNMTVGFDEERVRGAAKVQMWLEGL